MLLVAGTCLLALAPGPAAGAAPSAAAKAKRVVCKSGTVVVVVQRTRRCRPSTKVFPQPLAGDVRLAFLKAAIASDLSGLRDRRGRRLPSTRRMFARIGPRAYAALLHEVPRALAHLDHLASRTAGAARRTGAARAHGAEISFSDNYKLTVAGVGLEFGFSGGESLGLKMVVTLPQKDGQKVTVTVRFGSPQATGLTFRQQCPMADGTLDAVYDLDVTTEVALYDAGGTMTSFDEDVAKEHAVLHGQTADDAKLDFVDVSDTLKLQQSSGGSIYGTVRQNSEFQHTTRIDMRTGKYVAGQGSASSVTKLTGVLRLLQGLVKDGPSERVQANADNLFAGTIKATIDRYRELEGRWNTPNTCAAVRFAPDSDGLTLSTGDTGAVTAKVERKDQPYDRPTTSAWTMSSPANATLTPATATANPQDFHYATTAAGSGVKVAATFRSVSKIGVAEATWTQPTTADPPTLSGTLGGQVHLDDGGSPIDIAWVGNVELVRRAALSGASTVYDLKSFVFTAVDYSENTGPCLFMGRDTPTITAGPAPGTAGVLVVEPGVKPSYRAGLQVTSGSINGALSTCPVPSGQDMVIGQGCNFVDPAAACPAGYYCDSSSMQVPPISLVPR